MNLVAVAGVMLVSLSAMPVGAEEDEHPIEFPPARASKNYGWHNLQPLERNAPQYPRDLSLSGQEGWVHIGYTIAEDGTVLDPVVIASYPGNVFNRPALRALRHWTYAVPTEDEDYTLPMEHQIVFTFQITGMDGVRRTLGRRLLRIRGDLFEEKDLDKAKRQLDSIAQDARKNKLNLYELAALEQAHALYDLTVGDYDAAVTHAERTLRMGKTFDEENIKVTHHMLLTAYFNLQKYEQVVRVYDDWLAIDPNVVEQDFAPMVEKMRADIARQRGS